MGKTSASGRLRVQYTQRDSGDGKPVPALKRKSLRERLREAEDQRDRLKESLAIANQNTLNANRVVDAILAACAKADETSKSHITTGHIRKVIEQARAEAGDK